MITRPSSLILPLSIVAVCALPAAALAQQAATPAKPKPATTTAAPAKPAAAKPAAATPAKPAAAKPAAPAKPAAAAKPAPARPAQVAAAPAVGGAQPSLLGQYGEWGAYAATPNGRKVCFALAKPNSAKTIPAGRPRDPAYMFISSRPSEKVKDEISVIVGYPLKAETDATAEIGTTKFAMYTQNDGAWIKNAAEEARLVDAMRKGSDLVIKGMSGRGTQSHDTYSLRGLDQALKRVADECR
jgi:hypothetical protein